MDNLSIAIQEGLINGWDNQNSVPRMAICVHGDNSATVYWDGEIIENEDDSFGDWPIETIKQRFQRLYKKLVSERGLSGGWTNAFNEFVKYGEHFH